MKKKNIYIVISGALGRMGKAIISEIKKNKNISLSAFLINPISFKKNQNNLKNKLSYISLEELEKKKDIFFDIMIDFTTPTSTINNLKYCIKKKKKMIIGTTGLNKEEMKEVVQASKKIAIVYSPNFSIGINLIYILLRKSVKILGNSSDIEIIEYHHKNKKDAPSGTALQLGKIISETMNWKFENHSTFVRNGYIGIRKEKTIGFSVIRAGNIIGKHKIFFLNSKEKLEISHTAIDRNLFAQGVILSILWLNNKNTGFFSMEDILKNKLKNI